MLGKIRQVVLDGSVQVDVVLFFTPSQAIPYKVIQVSKLDKMDCEVAVAVPHPCISGAAGLARHNKIRM